MRDKPLDELDLAIIDELRRDVMTPLSEIAVRQKVSQSTVTNRVRALIADQVMLPTIQRDVRWEGYELAAFVDVHVAGRPLAAVVADLAQFNDVATVTLLAGRAVIRVHAFSSGVRALHETVIEPISRLPGVSRTVPQIVLKVLKYTYDLGVIGEAPRPVVDRSQPLERQIVELLSADARTSNRKVARMLGVSEGTVRSRLKKLQDDKLIHIGLVLDVRVAGYAVSAYLRLNFPDGRIDEAVRRLLRQARVSSAWRLTGEDAVIAIVGDVSYASLVEYVRTHIEPIPGLQLTAMDFIDSFPRQRFELIHLPESLPGYG